MPTTTSAIDLVNVSPKVAALQHPLYLLLKQTWIQLLHVRNGLGGFLNGDYLVAHPREWLDHSARVTDRVTGLTTTMTNPNPKQPSPKLKARRALARYENLASTILEAKKSTLFRQTPTRSVGGPTPPGAEQPPPTDIETWWTNVDGQETDIDDAMEDWWDLAASFGHVVLYFELPDADDAQTAADQAQPTVRVYSPLDVIHWLLDDDGNIIAIKVLEAVPTVDFLGPVVTQWRIRIIDETGWALYDFKSGTAIEKGEHGLGRLPVVYMYGKRRPGIVEIGDSVLGDPRNYIDLYNLTSELRELLRNQTFSFINLPLGTGPDAMDVEKAQTMLGQQTGTMNVLFSGGPANILTGDANNVTSYHAEIDRLKRHIYREAGVQWEADTRAVEAAGSLSLKREDMASRLAAYGKECQQAEYSLAELFYRWKYGADRGVQKMQDDIVTIQYPEKFTDKAFTDVLAEAQAAQTLNYPPLFMKELRKGLVTKFEGMANLPAETLTAVIDAIENAPDDPTPQEKLKMKLDAMAGAGGKPGAPGQPGAVPAPKVPAKGKAA